MVYSCNIRTPSGTGISRVSRWLQSSEEPSSASSIITRFRASCTPFAPKAQSEACFWSQILSHRYFSSLKASWLGSLSVAWRTHVIPIKATPPTLAKSMTYSMRTSKIYPLLGKSVSFTQCSTCPPFPFSPLHSEIILCKLCQSSAGSENGIAAHSWLMTTREALKVSGR